MKCQLQFSSALLMLPMGHGADIVSPEELRRQADALATVIDAARIPRRSR